MSESDSTVPATNAEVTATLPTGTDWYYRVRYGDTEVMVRENDHPNLAPGSSVRLAAFPNPIKVFGADGLLSSRDCNCSADRPRAGSCADAFF